MFGGSIGGDLNNVAVTEGMRTIWIPGVMKRLGTCTGSEG